jgi:hypothetical protein
MLERTIRAQPDHFSSGRADLAELAELARLRPLLLEVIDLAVVSLLDRDASQREIAIALGITQQAVQQRYPGRGRRPGGQPANLR